MTEDLENVDQGVDGPETNAEVETDDEVQQPIYNKRQLQDVVTREKRKAFERGKKEALMQIQNEQGQVETPAAQAAPQQSSSMGGMGGLSQAEIERLIAERTSQAIPQALQSHIQRMKQEHTVESFVNKMQAAEQKYPGIEAKLNKLNYEDPSLLKAVEMASSLENTADVMQELVTNPGKLGDILTLVERQPFLAEQALMNLSNSIKTNQDALSQEKRAQDPMSQLKPSSNIGMDNKDLSVNDLRAMFPR